MESYIKIKSKDLDIVKQLFIENKIKYEEFTSNFYKNVCIEEAKVQLENHLSDLELTIEDIDEDLSNKIIEQVSDNIYDEYDLFDEISEKTKNELETILNELNIKF